MNIEIQVCVLEILGLPLFYLNAIRNHLSSCFNILIHKNFTIKTVCLICKVIMWKHFEFSAWNKLNINKNSYCSGPRRVGHIDVSMLNNDEDIAYFKTQ